MTEKITHRYLRMQLKDFGFSDEVDDLLVELQYSTLISPKVSIQGFSIIRINGLEYVPLFTDIDEYEKAGEFGGAVPVSHDFNFYLECLQDEGFQGFVINPSTEHFYIGCEFLEVMEPNYIFENEYSPWTVREIRKLKDSIDDREIKKHLEDNADSDFIGLIGKLRKTKLLTLLKYDGMEQIDGEVFSAMGVPQYVHKTRKGNFYLIFTSDSEIDVSSRDGYYSQLVNLPLLMERVLNDDLDGIVLNANSDNILISRKTIRRYMKDFSCPLLDDYSPYAFEIK